MNRIRASGDDLLEGLGEFGVVDVFVVLCEFEVGVTGEVVAFEVDEAFAFDGEGVFVELVEEEDAVGDLDNKFGVCVCILESEVLETAVDDGVGDGGFYVVEPVVFGLKEEGAASYDVDEGVDAVGIGDGGFVHQGREAFVIEENVFARLELPVARFLVDGAGADLFEDGF